MVNLALEDYIYCNSVSKNEYRIFMDCNDKKKFYNEEIEQKPFENYPYSDNTSEHALASDHSTTISDEDKNISDVSPSNSEKQFDTQDKIKEKVEGKRAKKRRRRRTIPQNPHSMVTRAYTRYVSELLLANDLPSNYLQYFDSHVPIPELTPLEEEAPKPPPQPSVTTIEELVEVVTLPEDLTYYFDIYKVEIFDIKKNRRNSKHLSHIVFTLPFETVLGKKITTKYVYSSIYSIHSIMPVMETMQRKFSTISTILENSAAHVVFSTIIKNLIEILGNSAISPPIDDEYISCTNLVESKNKLNALIAKKKALKSWNANAIMSKLSKQPKLMPLGQWASFFCGDYKDKNCTDPDYIDGMYLVNIDDIPIDLDKFENQFNWEVDLLWERNEISLEERDEWYRLAGLDDESLESCREGQKRYESNQTLYGNLADNFNRLDDHIIDKFNIINQPDNYKPITFLEPKIKYSRSYVYKEGYTKYSSKTDPYFAFKLFYRFPHEFIDPL